MLRASVKLPVALEQLGEWEGGVSEREDDELCELDNVGVQAGVMDGLAEYELWVVDTDPRVAVVDQVWVPDADMLSDADALQEGLGLPLSVAVGEGLGESDAERVNVFDQASEAVPDTDQDPTVPDGDTLGERLAVRVDEPVAVSMRVGLGLREAVQLQLELVLPLKVAERDKVRFAVPEAEKVGEGDGVGEEVNVPVGVGISVGDSVLDGDTDWLPVCEVERVPEGDTDRVLHERVAVSTADRVHEGDGEGDPGLGEQDALAGEGVPDRLEDGEAVRFTDGVRVPVWVNVRGWLQVRETVSTLDRLGVVVRDVEGWVVEGLHDGDPVRE